MIKPIKYAVLSCNHGHAYKYYGLSSSPYYDLKGVSVANGYRHKVRLEPYPEIEQYDSDDALFEAHPDIEAVVIASDNASHFRQVKWAVERGLHILSMKVPTFDMWEYEEMMRLTREAGLVCMIELEMRHHAEILRMKDLIERGGFNVAGLCRLGHGERIGGDEGGVSVSASIENESLVLVPGGELESLYRKGFFGLCPLAELFVISTVGLKGKSRGKPCGIRLYFAQGVAVICAEVGHDIKIFCF